MKTSSVRLYDIAECNLYNKDVNSKFKIPNIQRGLVWKSIQMELLWDSILRGFPIGSMLVLDRKGNGGGDILDGQQRANAIITTRRLPIRLTGRRTNLQNSPSAASRSTRPTM